MLDAGSKILIVIVIVIMISLPLLLSAPPNELTTEDNREHRDLEIIMVGFCVFCSKPRMSTDIKLNNASLDACGNRMELRSNRIKLKKILFAKRSCSGAAGSSDHRKRC